MDARPVRTALVALSLILVATTLQAATFRTRNFVVTAPTEDVARQVAQVAEESRKAIALDWLGHELRNWYRPCPVSVTVGQMGAGGATSFNFDRDAKGQMQVFGWNMRVQGSLERILDSVIPHEVSHTIFACHFRRPLPRWADEGAATLVEHDSEQARQRMVLKQVLEGGERIPLKQLFAIKEYPSDMRKVLSLYAQGYSLADFLVEAGGKKRYLEFLNTAEAQGWDAAIQQHYEVDGTDELETRWNDWVLAGSRRFPKDQQLADASTAAAPAVETAQQPLVRSQSPDAAEPEPIVEEVAQTSAPRGRAGLTSPVLRAIKTNQGWSPVESPRLFEERPPFEDETSGEQSMSGAEPQPIETTVFEEAASDELLETTDADLRRAGMLRKRLKQASAESAAEATIASQQ